MRYASLFSKTIKQAPADEVAQSAQLLIRAGYIHKEMAGVYSYLPLGLRVIGKIQNIIRAEMNAIGAHELLMSSLQSKEVWEITKRWDDDVVDVWFKSKLKTGADVGFGWSHEEPITHMMRRFLTSYKDYPAYVYQFQTKLRNELRAKSGIMRGREFMMKDLYSYDVDEQRHLAFYERVKEAYMKVFQKVGIGDRTYVTFAAGGAFTKYSHEFQTLTEVGEDWIYVNTERGIAINEEVYEETALAQLGVTKQELQKVRSAEVGNIFNFGTAKCDDMQLFARGQGGEQVPVYLGSYGIGVSRLVGVISEIFADKQGLVWPEAVSPYRIHLVGLDLHEETVRNRAERLYTQLQDHCPDMVLFDDRIDTRAGAKFADADLIGCPIRIVVSKRTGDSIEVKKRTESESRMIDVQELFSEL